MDELTVVGVFLAAFVWLHVLYGHDPGLMLQFSAPFFVFGSFILFAPRKEIK